MAESDGLWFHVDAAWGGGAIASDRLRPLLAGIERADSITIDAHKWFATTMGCGMFLTRRPSVLSAAFRVSTGYMPSNVENVDPYVTSVQWSRRLLGLRLFLSLAAAGWQGYATHVEKAVALAGELAAALHARGWRLANDSALAVLCLLPPEGAADVKTIVGRVLASGVAWISVASFGGHSVIRACVTNGETTRDDIFRLVAALEAARQGFSTQTPK
jgi:glutamate/tyrosine decarboxylase-like PLP-dependent enzyme